MSENKSITKSIIKKSPVRCIDKAVLVSVQGGKVMCVCVSATFQEMRAFNVAVPENSRVASIDMLFACTAVLLRTALSIHMPLHYYAEYPILAILSTRVHRKRYINTSNSTVSDTHYRYRYT